MNYIALTLISVLTGTATGVIGAGPEVLIIPLLGIFNILQSTKHRIGTSLFMLLPPIGLFAAIKYYKKGYVDLKASIYMAVLFTIFASISSKYSSNMDESKLKKLFGIFTIICGLYIYYH